MGPNGHEDATSTPHVLANWQPPPTLQRVHTTRRILIGEKSIVAGQSKVGSHADAVPMGTLQLTIFVDFFFFFFFFFLIIPPIIAFYLFYYDDLTWSLK